MTEINSSVIEAKVRVRTDLVFGEGPLPGS